MFYRINQHGRWMAAQIEYHTIDWTSFDSVVDAFNSRLTQWYIEPAEILKAQKDSGHLAFPVMALNCVLLETLSQFAKGSGKARFKEFVSERIPEFQPNMPETIQHKDPQSEEVTLVTYADALYHAFRCGILHEAHVAAYGIVRHGDNLVAQVPEELTWYEDGSHCATVAIDPWKLLAKVKEVLAWYVAQLKDPVNNAARQRFKEKFTECFGVDIMGAN